MLRNNLKCYLKLSDVNAE